MRFVRYISVQVLAYGLDMGSFLLALGWWGAPPLLANVFGKIVAGCFAFFVHRSFTFNVASGGRQGSQAIMYTLLLALNIPLSAAVLATILAVLPHPVAAKFVSDVICVLATYWLSKRYVFSGRKPPHAGGSGVDLR